MKETTACCFSGHRPQKLPWGWNETDPACTLVLDRLEEVIRTAIQSGARCFYTGMALGTDLWAAVDRRPPVQGTGKKIPR